MAATALLALPLIGKLTQSTHATHIQDHDEGGVLKAVGRALQDRSYLLLHVGFFTCGFHIAFLVTHLPGEVNLCGLPPSVASWSLAIIGLANIFGSLCAGAWVSRYRSKHVLAAMYASRVVLIGGYLLLPPSAPVFYVFAAGLGFTWLATVPPTAAIVGMLAGAHYGLDSIPSRWLKALDPAVRGECQHQARVLMDRSAISSLPQSIQSRDGRENAVPLPSG